VRFLPTIIQGGWQFVKQWQHKRALYQNNTL